MWREPRAPGNPGMVWWDRWLVGGIWVIAVLETVLRTDVTWPVPAAALAIGLSFTLLWRRSHPFAMVAITFGVLTVMNAIALVGGDTSFGLYTMMYVLLFPYALHRWGSGREIVAGLAIIVVALTAGIVADFTTVGEAIAAYMFALSPALIGATVRYWAYARDRDRDQAVLYEREQIARELHDTVAHHVSAIAIQAQAGRALAKADPDAPLAVLGVIEAEASKTLTEMRAMVGALRRGDEPELAPTPGVADIPRLAEDSGSSLTVSVDIATRLEDLVPGVDAALYRIAQESLTNVMRHAQDATTADVTLTDLGDSVGLVVRDDGRSSPHSASAEAGYGLLGMAERAKLLGGEFSAGPAPNGGWLVTAELPKEGAIR